jgi:hypothetical protein
MQNQQQQQSQPPYLFYSEKCEHSQRIFKLIRDNPALVNGVKPISIEKAASLPPNLTSVPAILYNGKLFTGNDAFGWVQFQNKQMGGGARQQDPNSHLQRNNNLTQLPNAQSQGANAMKNMAANQGTQGTQGTTVQPDEGPGFLPIGGDMVGASISLMGDSPNSKFTGQTELNSGDVMSGDGFMSLTEFGDGSVMSGSGLGSKQQIGTTQQQSMMGNNSDPSRMNGSDMTRPGSDEGNKRMSEMKAAREKDVPNQAPRVGGGIPPISMNGGQMGQMGNNQMGQMPMQQQGGQAGGQPMDYQQWQN